MNEIFVFGVMMFFALIVVIAKLPKVLILRMLGYELIVDIAFFVGVKALLIGTVSGMVLAFLSGLIFSIVLHGMKLALGYERYEQFPCSHCGTKFRKWTYHPPRIQLNKT